MPSLIKQRRWGAVAARGRPLACALALTGLLAFILRLWPLYRFAIWGSDSGEYLLLTHHLVDRGELFSDSGYLGFGFAYPYFQGMEVWAGTLALATGWEVPCSVWLAAPFTAWLVAPLVGLLTLRILNNNRLAAVVAAAFVAVSLPHVAATSHTMPGTPGETLALLCLLLHLRALERPKWYVPLVPTFLALLVTHHLSLYFYLLGAFGLWLMHCLFLTPEERRVPTMEGGLWFAAMALLTSYYWLVFAQPFGNRILAIQPGPTALLIVAPLAGLALLTVLLYRWPGRLALQGKVDSYRMTSLKVGGFLTFLLLMVIIAALWGLPGTAIELPPTVFLYILPLGALLAFCTFPRLALYYPRGHLVIGWVGLPLISLIFASATASRELISYRHMPYLMESIALLVGLGIVGFLALPELGTTSPLELRRKVISLFLAGTVSMAALLAYPPPELFGGFQEGTSQRELDLVLWGREGMSGSHDPTEIGPRVATDHRLSTFLFGIGGATPTWDLAGDLIHTPELGANASARLRVKTPEAGSGPARYVALSKEVRKHVALEQWEAAEGISDMAQAKFERAPFIRIFDNGEAQVYLVDHGMV